jgi:type I site-specific restriction endonuclease
VRQHFIQFLINQKQYPKGLFAIEKGLKLHERNKRTDIVVYNSDAKPLLIVECKAPTIKIDQSVFDQIIRYNYVHQAKYLVLSNGLVHYCCEVNYEKKHWEFIAEIPEYPSIIC